MNLPIASSLRSNSRHRQRPRDGVLRDMKDRSIYAWMLRRVSGIASGSSSSLARPSRPCRHRPLSRQRYRQLTAPGAARGPGFASALARLPRRPACPGGACRAVTPSSPLATNLEPQGRAVRADRPPLPDQPRHRPAALRRPAADRGRGAGQGLGRRGRADAGQGPLAPRRSTSASTTSATTAAARTSTRAS